MKQSESSSPLENRCAWNPSPRAALLIVGLIFAAALVIRIAFWCEFRESDLRVLLERPELDSQRYHAWAQKIVDDKDLLLEDEGLFTLSPCYSYCLAVVYALFGSEMFTAILVQLLLGAAATVLMFLAGSQLFNRFTGIAAAAITAFYGQYVLTEGLLLSEAFLPFMTALFLCWTAWSLKKGKPQLFIVSGLLTRDRERRKENFKIFVFGAIGAVVAAAPILIRNVVVSGKPVLLTTTGGVNFYIGNHSKATGTWTIPQGFRTSQAGMFEDFAREAGAEEYDETVSRYWASQALEDMSDDPGAWIGLMLKKAALFWNNHEIPVNFDYAYFRKNLTTAQFAFIPFGVVAILGLLGAWFALRWRRDAALGNGWILLLGLGYFLGTIIFFVSARYRVAIVPYVILLAAYAVERIALFFREKGWADVLSRIGVKGGLIVAAAVIVTFFCYADVAKRVPPQVETSRCRFMGFHFWEQGDPVRAEKWFRESLEIDGINPIFQVYLAGLLLDMGQDAEAARHCIAAENLVASRIRFFLTRGGREPAALTAREVTLRWNEAAEVLEARGQADEAQTIRDMSARIMQLVGP